MESVIKISGEPLPGDPVEVVVDGRTVAARVVSRVPTTGGGANYRLEHKGGVVYAKPNGFKRLVRVPMLSTLRALLADAEEVLRVVETEVESMSAAAGVANIRERIIQIIERGES